MYAWILFCQWRFYIRIRMTEWQGPCSYFFVSFQNTRLLMSTKASVRQQVWRILQKFDYFWVSRRNNLAALRIFFSWYIQLVKKWRIFVYFVPSGKFLIIITQPTFFVCVSSAQWEWNFETVVNNKAIETGMILFIDWVYSCFSDNLAAHLCEFVPLVTAFLSGSCLFWLGL